MLDDLVYKQEDRGPRDHFYASDCGKSNFDLYHSFVGTPVTNPPKWHDTLKWAAGSGVEDAMVKILKSNGIVNEDYDQNVHGKIEMERNGIRITGRIDAMTKDGLPIEIKSINNANRWDVGAYEDGYPRENYVGQLAVYMDALGVDVGYLFVSSIDGLSRFWFKCVRTGDKFTCGNTVFELDKQLAKWKNLFDENITKKIEPDVWEYKYKYPVEEIDWTKVSSAKITSARNNRAVLGDYQVQWSSYKDMWVKKQGVTLGYTAEELLKINELTKGHTTWNKK